MANLFLMSLSLIVFYLAGWNLMWSAELKFVGDLFTNFSMGTIVFNDFHFNETKYFIEDKSYFFSTDLVVFSFNELYYGLYNSNRFFNSVIVENMALVFGLMLFFKSLDFTMSKN